MANDYEFVLDGAAMPGPSSRWQPQGIRGPSRVFDPARFAWNDDGFTPPTADELVIYELQRRHVQRGGGRSTRRRCTWLRWPSWASLRWK